MIPEDKMNKKKRNFKQTLYYLFLKYSVIPIILAFILFFVFMVFAFEINTVHKTNQASLNISRSLEQVCKNYQNEIEKASRSEYVIDLIKTRRHSNLVYDEFYKFNNSQKVKSTFYIVDKKNVLLVSTAPNSDSEIENSRVRSIIDRIEKKPDKTLIEADFNNYPNNKNTVYTFAKAVKDHSGNTIGYMIYQLFEDDLQKIIMVPDNEIAVVVDEYGSIIVTNNNSVKGLMNKFNPRYYYKDNFVLLDMGKYYISKAKIPNMLIYIYTMNPVGIRNIIYILYTIFLILTSFVLVLLLNYLAKKMSSRNTESIDKLIFAINELQNGKMDFYVDIKSGDEFEILANQYNKMLNELNILIKKNQELSDLRRITEIKQLQSQFNPHFMFNVLETLRYSILIEPKEAEKIVISLSKLLRYSVNYDGQKVLMKQDLDYIQDYLTLNKFRFNDRLEYTIDIPDNVRSAYVPKLLLQPIVENSIKYGYIYKDKLSIKIKGQLEGKTITLEVCDNGNGMTEDKLNELRKTLKSPENTSEHTGIYNVNRRIVLLYGSEYGVKIESAIGIGTSVKITIPFEEAM